MQADDARALRRTYFVSGSHTFPYGVPASRTSVGDGGPVWLVRLRNDRAASEHPAGRDWAEVKPEGVEADV